MVLEVSQPPGPTTGAVRHVSQALSKGPTGTEGVEAVKPTGSDMDHHWPPLPREIMQHAAIRAVHASGRHAACRAIRVQ